MNIHLSILLVIAASLISNTSFASPNQGTVNTGGSSSLNYQSVPSVQSLNTAYGNAKKKLQDVEFLVRKGSYGPAYKQALEIMSDIKQKTGVNPIAKFREKIKIANTITNADLRLPYDSLTNIKKERLARAVARHYRGQYINLLNLAKRARVIYVRAYYHANKHRLYKREIEKLKRDLVNIHNIPILFQDNISNSYLIFDLDVADEDIQISFNKEILDTAADVLNVREQEFEQLLASSKQKKLAEHWNGLQQVASASSSGFISVEDGTYQTSLAITCKAGYVAGRKYYAYPPFKDCISIQALRYVQEYKTSYQCAGGFTTGRSYSGASFPFKDCLRIK